MNDYLGDRGIDVRVINKLEPEAVSGVVTGNATDVLLASIAISARRIAEVLEQIDYTDQHIADKRKNQK